MKKISGFLAICITALASISFTGCSDIMSTIFGSGSGSSSSGGGVSADSGDMYDQNKTYEKGDQACFYSEISSSGSLKKIFTLKASGTYCNVWGIKNDAGYMGSISLSDSAYSNLASKFDSMYTYETDIFGSNVFTGYGGFISKSPEKINIIVYDIYGDSSSDQNGGVYGFFYSGDLYSKVYSSDSNQTELFNIDSYFLRSDTEAMYSTLFHEFQHMLHFVNKVVINRTEYPETWFNEMLSLVCEDILLNDLGIKPASGPMERLYLFNKYYNLGITTWRRDTSNYFSSGDVYISYSNAYAFGAYLLRNYGGIKLINQIATNAYTRPTYNSSTGWSTNDSVSMALKALGYSETFESVWKKFYQVLINTGSTTSSDVLSLNKSFTETFNSHNYSITAINLNGGVPGSESTLFKKGSTPQIYGINAAPSYPVGPMGFSVHGSTSDFDLSDYKYSSGSISLSKYDYGSYHYLAKLNNTSVEVAADKTGSFSSNIISDDAVFSAGLDRSVTGGTSSDCVSARKFNRVDFSENPEDVNDMLKKIQGRM